MYTETNPWGTIISRPRGLTNGSMEENEAMGGGISPPSKKSMVLGSPSSLVPLVLIIFFLSNTTRFLLNREEKFPFSNRVGISDTPINGSSLKLPSILIFIPSITSLILDNLRLITFFLKPNANLGF